MPPWCRAEPEHPPTYLPCDHSHARRSLRARFCLFAVCVRYERTLLLHCVFAVEQMLLEPLRASSYLRQSCIDRSIMPKTKGTADLPMFPHPLDQPKFERAAAYAVDVWTMPQGESVSASSGCAASDGAAACPPGYVEGANSNDGPGGVGSTDGNNCSTRLRAKGVHIMGSSCTGPVPDRPRLEPQWTVQDAGGGLDEPNLMPPPPSRQRRAQVDQQGEAAPSSSAV